MSAPFFFGEGAPRLFGVHAPPQGGSDVADRGVVLCYPGGTEYLRAHRTFRLLADRLARSGLHVLRFDYRGTGDSEGAHVDADLEAWRADVERAVHELRMMTGVRRIGLVGMRLGSAVSAAAATKVRAVRSVVLWDPVVDGTAYLSELAHRPSGAREGAAGEGVTVTDGQWMGPSMRAGIRAVDPELYRTVPCDVLLLTCEESGRAAALGRSLEARDRGSTTVRAIPGPRAWVQDRDFGAGAVPAAHLEELARWPW